MSSFDQAADRINAAVEKAEIGSEILSQVANGDEFTEVPTTSGPVPSLKKWQKDNMDLISGGVIARVDKAILSYPDYAAASAAAATLPDGQEVKVKGSDFTFSVTDGELVVTGFIDDSINYTGGSTAQTVKDALKARAVLSDFATPAQAYAFPGRVSVRSSATVLIPGDAPTLQAAIEKFIPEAGVTIDLLIESGHEPNSGINVKDGNFGAFKIKSEDSIVNLSDDFLANHAGHRFANAFVYARNAIAPSLYARVDALGKCLFGYSLEGASHGFVEVNCGVDNCYNPANHNEEGAGLFVNQASVCSAVQTQWRGSYRNAWVTHQSICHADKSTFDANRNDANVYVGRRALMGLSQGYVTNGNGHGLRVRRSQVVAMGSRFIDNGVGGAGTYCCLATEGSTVNLSGSTGEDAAGPVLSSATCGGINAESSTAIANNAEVNLPGQTFINATNGSFVSADFSTDIVCGPRVINATNSKVKATNCTTAAGSGTVEAVRALNSDVDLTNCNFASPTRGISAQELSRVNAPGLIITNATTDGVVSNGGSVVRVRAGAITGSSAGRDLVVTEGSQIYAQFTSTTAGTGGPAIADTNVTGFNSFARTGVIFN